MVKLQLILLLLIFCAVGGVFGQTKLNQKDENRKFGFIVNLNPTLHPQFGFKTTSGQNEFKSYPVFSGGVELGLSYWSQANWNISLTYGVFFSPFKYSIFTNHFDDSTGYGFVKTTDRFQRFYQVSLALRKVLNPTSKIQFQVCLGISRTFYPDTEIIGVVLKSETEAAFAIKALTENSIKNQSFFLIQPEIGAKYVFKKGYEIGLNLSTTFNNRKVVDGKFEYFSNNQPSTGTFEISSKRYQFQVQIFIPVKRWSKK